MDFIKAELDKEFSAVGFKNQRRNLYTKKHQIGKTNLVRDAARKALAPGKRMSKSGNKYYEYRKNRSDLVKKKI